MSLKVMKFSAIWCPPCKALQPIWEKLVDEMHDVEFEAIDIDKEPKITKQYGVSAVPTIVFVKNGSAVESMVGLHRYDDIKAKIEELK